MYYTTTTIKKLCVIGHRGQDRDVILTLKHGVEAKSYDSVSGIFFLFF